MAKTSPTPQVPGEPVAAHAAEPVSVADPVTTDAAAEGTVSVSQAEFEAMQAELAALRAAKAAGQAPKRTAEPSDALPDQSSVDADTIKAPVLTRQGWVVPTEFGTPPAAKR